MEEKGKIELNDAFGKPYSVLALPKEKIVKILEDLDIERIVKKAYEGYVSGMSKGVAQLNIEDGSLVGAQYTTGTGDIEKHYIDLYTISSNLDLGLENILDKAELQKYYEMVDECSLEEFCERNSISYQDRELEALITYAYDVIRSDEWWKEIEGQLNEIYGHGDETELCQD